MPAITAGRERSPVPEWGGLSLERCVRRAALTRFVTMVEQEESHVTSVARSVVFDIGAGLLICSRRP